ncbi:MAG: hypothetical protein IJ418_09600 [Clostridia bacterium]|nr:hypothetical protein [Clostridia bacterium]
MQRRIHKTEINKTWVLMIFAAVAFAMSLLPILISAFYAHPLYDDYWFSSGVYHQVTRGGSIIDILRAAADMVKDIYVTWQGSFSAVFLFSLQPGVFGQDYYFLTTFIMLGLLIGSHVFLFDTILVKWLKLRKEYEVLLTLFMLTMIIQFIPDIRQAFYWYNGSCYYTLFYSLSVILVGTMIRIELKRSRVSFRNTFPLSLLAFFIGGELLNSTADSRDLYNLYTHISV